MSVNRTPADWTAGETPTATKMQTEIKGLWDGLQAAWDTYAPSWTASGTAPAIGNGTLTGRFLRVGKTVLYRVRLDVGSTTTFGTGFWLFSLQILPANSQNDHLGSMICFDASAGTRPPRDVFLNGSNVIGTDTTGSTFVGPTAPFTWAAGDALSIAGTYEAA